SDLSSYSLQAEQVSAACRQAGIRFTHIPVRDFDRAALEMSLDECVLGLDRAMARPGSRVYLHCTAGRNRAPTVAAAFLIRDRGMTAHAAFAHVTGCRDCQPYLSLLESYQVSIERSRGPAAGAGPGDSSPPPEDTVP
ncbi:MAG: hypothetical protein FJW35_09205, partial [Acidobacteria bacterium]|nr:hypothetical protein [Acidobacteriota bacterium]